MGFQEEMWIRAGGKVEWDTGWKSILVRGNSACRGSDTEESGTPSRDRKKPREPEGEGLETRLERSRRQVGASLRRMGPCVCLSASVLIP